MCAVSRGRAPIRFTRYECKEGGTHRAAAKLTDVLSPHFRRVTASRSVLDVCEADLDDVLVEVERAYHSAGHVGSALSFRRNGDDGEVAPR